MDFIVPIIVVLGILAFVVLLAKNGQKILWDYEAKFVHVPWFSSVRSEI